METNLKKLVPILGVAVLSLAQAFAGSYDNSSDEGKDNTKAMVPAGANMPGEDGPHFFVSADYTLWTARQDGLATALDNYFSTPATNGAKGKVYYPKWKLRSGFKVGAGAFFDHDAWDVAAQYTWFYNKTNKASANKTTWASPFQGESTIIINPVTSNAAQQLSQVQSKWDNQFNRIDVQLARAFFAGHYLTFRPFLGLSGSWETQWLDVDYVNSGITASSVRAKQDFWGVGPYGGGSAAFCVMHDKDMQWNIFSDWGMCLPWSTFTTDERTRDANQKDEQHTANHYSGTTPMLEMSLGLRFESYFSTDWSFLLQAAWEQHVLFNHNHIHALRDNGGKDMTLQGLTIKGRVAF